MKDADLAIFTAGWEAAMRFADYPRSYDERNWDSGDVRAAFFTNVTEGRQS